MEEQQENISESEQETHETVIMYTVKQAELRREPRREAEVIEILDIGESVEVMENRGEWSQVLYNGETGYIRSEYLSTEKKIENEHLIVIDAGHHEITSSKISSNSVRRMGFKKEQSFPTWSRTPPRHKKNHQIPSKYRRACLVNSLGLRIASKPFHILASGCPPEPDQNNGSLTLLSETFR